MTPAGNQFWGFSQPPLDRTVKTPSNSRLVQETGSPSAVGLWRDYDGSSWSTTEEGFVAWKFNTEIPLPVSVKGWAFLETTVSGGLINSACKFLGATSNNGQWIEVSGELTLTALLEDFTLSTLDKSTMVGLNQVSSLPNVVSARGEAPSGNYLYDIKSEHDAALYDGLSGADDRFVYGFAAYVNDYTHTADTLNSGDEYVYDCGFDANADVYFWVI